MTANPDSTHHTTTSPDVTPPAVPRTDTSADAAAFSAELLPLIGKYYGTGVKVADGDDSLVVNIWFKGGPPSSRELGEFTADDWDRNVMVEGPAGSDGTMVPIRDADIIDWSHHESQRSLDVASKMVAAINAFDAEAQLPSSAMKPSTGEQSGSEACTMCAGTMTVCPYCDIPGEIDYHTACFDVPCPTCTASTEQAVDARPTQQHEVES